MNEANDDLEDFVRDAQKQREFGGRLERVPRSSVPHRCTPPGVEKVMDVREDDLWHCDCGKRFIWRRLTTAHDPIYAWREIHYPWAIVFEVVLHGIAALVFIASITAVDHWYIGVPMVFVSALLSFLAFFVRDTLKR